MGKAKSADADLHLVERGSGLPLLFVHGFPLDHTMWAGQLQELAAHARILAPDLRSFGRSAAGGETVPMEQFADDLAALLDARGFANPWCSAGYPWAATSAGSSSDGIGRGCGD